MKKSILSLSAAVALGGLGFAGSANAIAVIDSAAATADILALNGAGVGHILYTPYFTAQEQLSTLVNIVNTDTVNGKIVKVRFRGATNSDDLLDFTLFLSPGDVWSGAVTRGESGHAQINSSPDETSCTIPEKASFPGVFSDLRLPSYASADVKAALTREGYVEVLNMADIPPSTLPLYTSTKHVNGVAPCASLPTAALLSTTVGTLADARALGMDLPTGGLMGSWTIINQGDMGSWSGAQPAVAGAVAANPVNPNGSFPQIPAGIAFTPQIGTPINNVPFVELNTSDPLLSGLSATGAAGAAPAITPLWFDLPDMSTPITLAGTTAGQLIQLTNSLGKATVLNEYIATAAGAAVPFATDWVMSQPTRRYWAAVRYSGAAATAAIVPNINPAVLPVTPYSGLTLNQTAFGPQACLDFSFGSFDREEGQRSASGGFSPGATSPFCGEVFTVQFGTASVLGGAITARSVNAIKQGDAGWARLTTSTATRVPVTGFAAVLFTNTATGLNYNMTLPHRW